MYSTLGGRSPSGDGSSMNSASSSNRQRAVVAALEPDRRGGLEVDAGAAAERAAEVPGPDLDLVGSASSRSCSERKISAAPSRGSTARSGRATSPTNSESPVRTAPVAAAGGVTEQERGVLGSVAGRVDRLDRGAVAELEGPAVGERLVLVLGLGQLVDVDRRPGGPRQAAVAGDVVGVVVGLEHVLDPHPVQASEVEVGLDVPLRVDDRGDAGSRCRRPGRRRSRGPRG